MFEEQFGNQISEFARAKIALEEERARINRLDRIATETRRREAELYDVRLKQEQQRAEAAQMALDQAKLEQKHTSAIASAWAAMTQEGNLNEVRAVKGRGTGRMVFDDPMTGLRTTYELDPSGQTTRSSEGIKEGEATRETEAFKDYGLAKPSNEAALRYQAAIAAAAAEAPGAIKTFADITQALANATNAPEHAKLANDYMRSQIDYMTGKANGSAVDIDAQNKLAVGHKHGLDIIDERLKNIYPEAIDKEYTQRTGALQDRLANDAKTLATIISSIGGLSDLAKEATALSTAMAQASDLTAKGKLGLDLRNLTKRVLEERIKNSPDVARFQEPLLKLQAGIALNSEAAFNLELERMQVRDAAELKRQAAYTMFDDGYRADPRRDAVSIARTTVDTMQKFGGVLDNTFQNVRMSKEYSDYVNAPVGIEPQREQELYNRLQSIFGEEVQRDAPPEVKKQALTGTLMSLATKDRVRRRSFRYVNAADIQLKPTQ